MDCENATSSGLSKSLFRAKLGDFIQLLSGRDLESTYYSSNSSKGIPYITGASNINNHALQIDRWTINPIVVAKMGDLLLSCKGTIGKLCICDVDSAHIARQIMALRPNKQLDVKFLYYFMLNETQILIDKANSMIPGISRKDVLSLYIPILSISEQKQIVAILDKVFAKLDEVKEILEKQLINVEKLFQSLTNRLFLTMVEQYEQHPLLELTQTITKGSSPKWQGIKYTDEGGLLFITSENVLNNHLDLSNKKYVEPRFNQIEKKAELKKGDVLTNIVGASIGRTAIFDLDESANINQAVCLIRCIPELIDNRYLMFLLNSPFLVKHFHNNEINNARANLSLTFFRNLSIPLPPLSEQKEIVAQLNDIQELVNRMKDAYQHKLTCVEEFRKSILDKVFRGELIEPDIDSVVLT